MSKKNISKISLWILIFSILSLVTVAMVWSPRKELKIRGNADNLLERYDTSDIIEYSGCYISENMDKLKRFFKEIVHIYF